MDKWNLPLLENLWIVCQEDSKRTSFRSQSQQGFQWKPNQKTPERHGFHLVCYISTWTADLPVNVWHFVNRIWGSLAWQRLTGENLWVRQLVLRGCFSKRSARNSQLWHCNVSSRLLQSSLRFFAAIWRSVLKCWVWKIEFSIQTYVSIWEGADSSSTKYAKVSKGDKG